MARRKGRIRSLRTILAAAFVVMTLLPVLVAAVVGWLAIAATMSEQSLTTVTEHGGLASDLVRDRMTAQRDALGLLASDVRLVGQGAGTQSPSYRLRSAVEGTNLDYLLLVGKDGAPMASSALTETIARRGDKLVETAASGNAVSAFQIVPQAELDAVDRDRLGERGKVPLVETAGGPRPKAAPVGALSLVTAVPVKDDRGRVVAVLVGVEVLNRSTALVDAIEKRLGGTATIFQDVVRVSTTVRNAAGSRAIGTWAAAPVQQAYAAGVAYRGQAVVVGNQYMTSYEPLKDASGNKVGMLYVGVSMDPYTLARNSFLIRLFVALAVCLLVALLAAMPMARVLITPIARVSDAAEQVAAGDLRSEVPVSGVEELVRLGTSFNRMTVSLSGMIVNVRQAVDGLRRESTSILSSAEQQASTVTRQASAASETTATLEEMAASYRAVAENAAEVQRIAEEVLEAARDGQATLEESITATDEVHDSVEATADSAHEVTDVSERIGEVLFLIDSIAEQTKILALNAAIEAARAGEEGKGFAVVATEIRALATSVSKSTAQIEAMVRGIRKATDHLSAAAAEQSALAEHGSTLGHRASDAFADILEQLSSTTAAAREIAAASSQQRTAAEQVVVAMQQVTMAASESSRAADEVARAARTVDEHGRDLERSVDGLHDLTRGAPDACDERPPPEPEAGVRASLHGADEGIRTPDPRITSAVLWPAELRRRARRQYTHGAAARTSTR